MRVCVSSGPTREHIDRVRFITNASSGRMGLEVALCARQRGHDVTLVLGCVCEDVETSARDAGCDVVRFVSVDDLQHALEAEFSRCDALVMCAAVGDFRVDGAVDGKIARSHGSVTITLVPTEDILGGLCRHPHEGKVIVGFAVEAGDQQTCVAKAQAEQAKKGSDFTVVNTPRAMGARHSVACIISPERVVLPWASRPKSELALEIVKLLELEKS